MRKSHQITWALLALLLVSGWSTMSVRGEAEAEDAPVDDDDEYEDVARAHLVVRKTVADELVVQGRNVTVTIDIFNSGTTSAKAVKLVDALPEGAKLLDGTLEASLGRISEGSSAKHTYTMTFTAGGSGLVLPAATVTYKAEEGQEAQTGESSVMGVFVMTPVQQIIRYALVGGSYVSLGMARSHTDWRNIAIVLGLVGALLGGNFVMKASSASSVTRKRARALRELEKDE